MKSAFKALTTEIVNSIFVLLSVFLRLFITDPARRQAFDHMKDPRKDPKWYILFISSTSISRAEISRNQGVWWRVAAGQEDVKLTERGFYGQSDVCWGHRLDSN